VSLLSRQDKLFVSSLKAHFHIFKERC